MRKLLARTGIVLCAVGLLLGIIAGSAYFSPPENPTGAANYDRSVDAYNDRVDEIAESGLELPAMRKGKTLLQAHKEDTLFWMLVAGVITFAGLLLCLMNRSRRNAA